MEHDPLARALSAIKNAEAKGKKEVILKPASNLIKEVLNLLKKENYIQGFEFTDDKKGGILRVELVGTINNIGAIKPRYPVKLDNFDKFEARYLPAKDFGRIIVSTPKGLFTHIEAKTKKYGGVLLAFVY